MENNNKKLKIFLIITIVVAIIAVAGLVTTIIITNNMKNNDLGDNNGIEEKEEIEQENTEQKEEAKEEVKEEEKTEENEEAKDVEQEKNKQEKAKIVLPTTEEVLKCTELAMSYPGSPLIYAERIYGQTIDKQKQIDMENYTGIKYVDFEKKALSMFTKDFFENRILRPYKNELLIYEKDGELVVKDYGSSGCAVSLTDAKLVSETKEKLVYNVLGSEMGGMFEYVRKWNVEFVLNESNKYVYSSAVIDTTGVVEANIDINLKIQELTNAYANAYKAQTGQEFVKAIYGSEIETIDDTYLYEENGQRYNTADMHYLDFEVRAITKMNKDIFVNLNNKNGYKMVTATSDNKLKILNKFIPDAGGNTQIDKVYMNNYTGKYYTEFRIWNMQNGNTYAGRLHFELNNNSIIIVKVEDLEVK